VYFSRPVTRATPSLRRAGLPTVLNCGLVMTDLPQN
jgi:hypothetical protein